MSPPVGALRLPRDARLRHASEFQAVFQKGNAFIASIPVTIDWQPTLYTLTYFATSTDIYGGTTRSFTGKAQISVYACQTLG